MRPACLLCKQTLVDGDSDKLSSAIWVVSSRGGPTPQEMISWYAEYAVHSLCFSRATVLLRRKRIRALLWQLYETTNFLWRVTYESQEWYNQDFTRRSFLRDWHSTSKHDNSLQSLLEATERLPNEIRERIATFLWPSEFASTLYFDCCIEALAALDHLHSTLPLCNSPMPYNAAIVLYRNHQRNLDATRLWMQGLRETDMRIHFDDLGCTAITKDNATRPGTKWYRILSKLSTAEITPKV